MFTIFSTFIKIIIRVRWETKEDNQDFKRGCVRDGVFMEGFCQFSRWLTLNSLGIISQLERRGNIFNNLEVGFLFNELEIIYNEC